MDHPSYVHRALEADAKASIARTPEMAEGWRALAETCRALADQQEKLDRLYPHWSK